MPDILDTTSPPGPPRADPLVGAYAGLGGRGLTSAMVSAEVDPKCDPLGPDNLIVFAGGILAGTPVPNSGRLSVGAKSPLTAASRKPTPAARRPASSPTWGARRGRHGAAAELSLIEVDTRGARVKAAPRLEGLRLLRHRRPALRAPTATTPPSCASARRARELKAAAVIVTTPDFLPAHRVPRRPRRRHGRRRT